VLTAHSPFSDRCLHSFHLKPLSPQKIIFLPAISAFLGTGLSKESHTYSIPHSPQPYYFYSIPFESEFIKLIRKCISANLQQKMEKSQQNGQNCGVILGIKAWKGTLEREIFRGKSIYEINKNEKNIQRAQ
jgi:hypothetical protein